ncbi:MAG: serine hydrolase [Bacillota bacterium]|nr:serine hydrolase [Bacillota bacterium]
MKRILSICVIFAIIIFIPQSAWANAKPPVILADAAILMDADTGKILYSKNIDKAYPPASVTKTMTALLTLENCNLDDEVTVDKRSPLEDGSKIYIREGEKIKVKDLLYGLILASGNDCAGALATHIAGSPEAFAKMMNKRAKELGAKNTNFVNPCGLFNPNHKTSAYDLALIMRELIKHKEYMEISKTSSYQIAATNMQPVPRPLWNENKLIQNYSSYFYPYAQAGKTGYTTESKFSYIAYAKKGSRNLIAVILHENTKSYYAETIALFEYGFNNFENIKFFSKGDIVSSIKIDNQDFPLTAGSDFYYTREKGNTEVPTLNLIEQDLSGKSFTKQDNILKASIVYKESNIGQVFLKSSKDHILKKAAAVKQTFSYLKNILLFILYIFSGLLAAALLMRFYNKKRRKKYKSKYR